MNIFRKLFFKDSFFKYNKLVDKINNLESWTESFSPSDFHYKTNEFKVKLKSGEIKNLDEILPEAFALVREASRRTLGMRHFNCQLIGGIVLHSGQVVEMKTGEGKTLTETLSAYLNALTGNGVHIVSANDYLVERDFYWMKPIYDYLGVSAGFVVGKSSTEEKRIAYESDITYVSNHELGFDYLRDNMKIHESEMLFAKRGFNYCIIDEVDSILIDEARTPLIISGEANGDIRIYSFIDKIIKQLPADCYEIDEKSKSVQLTEIGNEKIESLLKKNKLLNEEEDLYSIHSFGLLNSINQSLKANFAFKIDADYMIHNRQVMIIDEFTGRIMEGRRYSDGLHQAIEAKEGVEVQQENQTLASTTYQNFFKMYKKLSGMTGTANTEAKEFYDIYGLRVVQVPTNKKIIRQDFDDLVYVDEEIKFREIVKKVKELHIKNQPVLIGTVTIEKSEKLSKMLQKEELKHQVLNAKHHEKEAKIIAEAGRLGAITIATNMAGRGTDIMLGGNLTRKIEEALELKNPKTEEEKTAIIEKIKSDHQIEKEKVIEAGGLFILGSERHENRRIDNQLLGRSGRQGDPGVSQFFLSLNDDLLRLFGGERMQGIMNMFKSKRDEVMNHSMINKVIERSQKRIESMHYEMRKNVLKYDTAMNSQRKIFIEQRMAFILSENMIDIIHDIIRDKNSEISEILKHVRIDHDEIYRIYGIRHLREDIDLSELNDIVIRKFDEKFSEVNKDVLNSLLKEVAVITLDEKWRYHLTEIYHLRESSYLVSYGQKDPISEFQMKSFNLFENLMKNFIEEFLIRIFKIDIKK